MANYHEVMDLNARSMPRKGGTSKAEVKRIEHERSANGGHVFTHHFQNSGGAFKEPEVYTFGKEEGEEALKHFAKHAGLSEHLEEPQDEHTASDHEPEQEEPEAEK